jgi:hypothetical protein
MWRKKEGGIFANLEVPTLNSPLFYNQPVFLIEIGVLAGRPTSQPR